MNKRSGEEGKHRKVNSKKRGSRQKDKTDKQ